MIQSIKNLFHLFQAITACIYYRYPAQKLTVIGVTGTDGKTTTSTLIYHLLKNSGYKVALISTVAAYIGDQEVDTGFHVTSPSPWQLQRLIHRIRQSGFTHLVLESTSHGLDQHRLFGSHITTAVLTNVTHEHLDYHRTYSRYLASKAKIFRSVHTAIINADDASFRLLLPYIKKSVQLMPYSLIENTSPGLIPDDTYHQIKTACISTFPQSYNRANALAASIAALTLGVSASSITKNLSSFPGVPGRMQHISNPLGIQIIVDFAHTPNALKQALAAAKQTTKGKLIAVFGSAGKRDKTKRPLMGEAASKLADEIILTAEDPRGEDVRLINQQIRSGIFQNLGHVHSIPNRSEAIQFALKIAQPGDTVIICGKGHEQSLNLDGHHEIPWSDVQAVIKLLYHGVKSLA